MTEGISGTARFHCSRCGHQHILTNEDFEFEAVSGSERSMGAETEYVSEIDMSCDSCSQEMNIRFGVWEYPTGAINFTDHSEAGASNVEAEFQILHSADEQPENGNRLIGAAAGGAILGASLGGPFGAVIGGAVGALLGDSVNKSRKRRG